MGLAKTYKHVYLNFRISEFVGFVYFRLLAAGEGTVLVIIRLHNPEYP